MTQSRLQQGFSLLAVNRHPTLLIQEGYRWQDRALFKLSSEDTDNLVPLLPLEIIVIFFVKLVHQFLIDSRPDVSVPDLGFVEHQRSFGRPLLFAR